MKRTLVRPTDEQGVAIQRGIAQDPDNPELTDEELASLRPAREVHPELVAEYLRTRGKQKAPTKVLVSLRLEREVVERLRASGRGWQARANDILRKAVLGA
jgi:uncharacterized protein (DUF4415 family)